jgi:integrase/recombinase XerD
MTADLAQLVEDYLRVRRSLGFKLKDDGHVLAGFLDYLAAHGTDQVTVANALGFATARPGLSRRRQALLLSAVRGFARWAHTVDASVQVPPARLLPARPTRAAPYIYTPAEISALLAAAGRLRPAMRAATFTSLVALMAATGVRTGEAIGLDVADFDHAAGTLTVTGKYGKVRRLPLHATVVDGLAGYLRLRGQLLPAAGCPALLVSSTGRRLWPSTVHPTFRAVADQAGLVAVTPACRPRLLDLRHTFAVSTMLDAYRRGGDPAVILPVLSTWLGHARPGDTYWYLTGTAELLAAATARLESHRGHGEADPS